MKNRIIVRYGEISLKGKNRVFFEKRLVKNIKECLKKNSIPYERVERMRNRIIIHSSKNCNILKNVFGIVSFSQAVETVPDLNILKKEALKLYKKGTFRFSAKRLDKTFKMPSREVNGVIGRFLVEKAKAKVNLSSPDIDIGIEFVKNRAFIFNKKIKALYGLPVGVEGRVAVILENSDSLKAAFLMMKRGCSIVFVKKKNISTDKLKPYSYGTSLEVLSKIPDNVKAVVVSETLNNLKIHNYRFPVLRPLLARKSHVLKRERFLNL